LENADFTPMKICAPDQDLILIVDDIPTNLAVISETLTDAGFEIAIATSGKRAIEQIKREQPDLILLDIMMPNMNGLEFCSILKKSDKFKHIPIIFMTASTDIQSKVQGFKLGGVDYITKPFEAEEVVARVNTHLELTKARKQLQEKDKRLNSILSSIKEVIWSANLNSFELLYLNSAVEEIYGHSAEELLQTPQLWFDRIHPQDRAALEQRLESPESAQSLDLEYRLIKTNNEVRWIHCRAGIIWSEIDNCYQVEGVLRDISDGRLAEQQLRHNAQYDSLTKIANRAYFTEYLTQLLAKPHHHRRRDLCALLFIDLDRFKSVNDNLGHGVGDQLLMQISKILQQCTRENDFIARLGGDEFTVILTHLNEASEANIVSQRILDCMNNPFVIADQTMNVTASIGIVADLSPYKSVSELLHHADLAMYEAKRLGKACHQLFKPAMYEEALRKQGLEHDLKKAIQHNQLQLAYQPIRTLEQNQLKGFEALMRWQHPSLGMVPPSTFIPLAEETGVIIELGECLLHLACQQILEWQRLNPDFPRITINLNISGQQLQDTQFVPMLDQVLASYGLTSDWFEIEITESSLMKESDFILEQLQSLRERGFTLSLDDFGTGYSSLSYLHRFPIDTLKIDRSFVQTMEPNTRNYEIVKTILSLAKILNLEVVAEGVETVEQSNALKHLQCDMVQGYFFSRPLDPEAATQYLIQEYDRKLPVKVG
jgi:diguanylate cyclase (GGDEF)-like protein/PAS domain S-box-containing protein